MLDERKLRTIRGIQLTTIRKGEYYFYYSSYWYYPDI
jgi:hypothetical protein